MAITVELIQSWLTRNQSHVRVTRGTPASDAQIAALEKKCGFAFPVDYKEFLRTFGALRLQLSLEEGMAEPGALTAVIFLGHAPGKKSLDLIRATELVATEAIRWDQVFDGIPVVADPPSWESDRWQVMHSDGLCRLFESRARPSKPQCFG